MDKAEEIFAEGIEDRNVKTIRQARVCKCQLIAKRVIH